MHRQRDASLPEHEDPQALANTFAHFFVDKIDQISKTFSSGESLQANERSAVPEIQQFNEMSEDCLKQIFMAGNSKSCHLDPIPTSLLKECIDLLIPVLTKIVNMSLTTCTFPMSCKFATLVPLLKKSSLDKEILKNFRPVSNLAYVGKLIEKVAGDQLNDHRAEHDLNPLNQSAYRKYHSIETALVKITNDILGAMDKKLCVGLVLLDLSAAFDTISHSILLRRLEEDYGVKGASLLWMESYFSGRTQAVNINGSLSGPTPLTTGMPQGSRIGPNEFPGYTSPIFAIAEKHKVNIHMYADDTQLYLPFKVEEYAGAMSRLEECISEIRTWLSENHLKLNDDKTEFVLIGQKHLLKNIDGDLSITIGNSTIPASENAKNIGAYIDSELNMKSHVNYIAKSAYYHLRNIGHIRSSITEHTAATLIHAFISSRLDNMNSLLVGLPECVVRKLQIVQNNAARLVTRTKRRDHITPVMKELHWLPVTARIKFKICLLTFKALNGLAPGYLTSLLSRYQPGRHLRSANSGFLKIKVPRLKTVGGRAFSTVAPKYWNKLPANIRNCEFIDTFKKRLKTHLFSECYD